MSETQEDWSAKISEQSERIFAARALKNADHRNARIAVHAGFKSVLSLSDSEHKYHDLFASVQDKIAGACSYCASAYGVKNGVEANGVQLLEDFEDHPSLRKYITNGYQILTFYIDFRYLFPYYKHTNFAIVLFRVLFYFRAKGDEMHPVTTPRIKICCIQSVEEAWLAIKYGASALGLVSEMPSGPGVISEKLIAEIAVTVPPGVATFLLTSKTDAESIIEQQKRCRVNTLQLVDRIETDSYEHLCDALPGISIVQVIHVTGRESVAEAEAVAPHVNAILLDSGNPNLKVKELGGTGRVHDWQFSKMIRARVDVPIYLAGGLKPGNVADAISKVGPFGLDICSGVRTDGKLDEAKLSAFFTQVGTVAKL